MTKWFAGVLILLLVLMALVIKDKAEILIESAESKTASGGAVYNRIKWFSYTTRDIWMMNQSHYGSNAKANDWERLAIVIDKTKQPKTARFYQLEPGGLVWEPNIEQRPFKVSCYMCHSNGPRAIRPNLASSLHGQSIWSRLKLKYWNLKIKSYGRVVPDPRHDELDPNLQVPFRLASPFENEKLDVKSCKPCHQDTGWLARGALRRQNFLSIRFMLNSGQMPPLGFTITNGDKAKILRFLGLQSL